MKEKHALQQDFPNLVVPASSPATLCCPHRVGPFRHPKSAAPQAHEAAAQIGRNCATRYSKVAVHSAPLRSTPLAAHASLAPSLNSAS
ncbi:hypothetical protein PtB15_4B723 [Puccinia triticina]|nr:hypothetical protein PtB15_4B723 [Puccinia triticina]